VNYSKELGRYYDTWVFSPEKDRFAVVFTDVTEKMNAEEALRRSEERWRSVFDTAAAGMVIISPAGTIQGVNPWICSLLGYTEQELVERSVEEITHPDDRDRTASYYGGIAAGEGSSIHYEKRYLCKDGRVIWGHASVACVLDDQQQPLYCIGLVQDTTERVQMEEGLRKANRELDAFVHTVAHDLRTPLTAITGYADILQTFSRKQLDEASGTYLDEIIRQGSIMMELLEDLLALAQVGRLERPTEPVDVGEVVDGVMMGLGYQLMAAEMRVLAGALPAARLPRTLLHQVFDNLIANAIRYAGPGGIIEVEGERDGRVIRFTVRDHGPGIPEGERFRVFDLFYRVSRKRKIKGTGVGLATVQKIARLYDGKAWVEETPGGGCTFRVEMQDE
jgi:PAS domain S-box-containing protein